MLSKDERQDDELSKVAGVDEEPGNRQTNGDAQILRRKKVGYLGLFLGLFKILLVIS